MNYLYIYQYKVCKFSYTYLKWLDKYDGVIHISKLAASVKRQTNQQYDNEIFAA